MTHPPSLGLVHLEKDFGRIRNVLACGRLRQADTQATRDVAAVNCEGCRKTVAYRNEQRRRAAREKPQPTRRTT